MRAFATWQEVWVTGIAVGLVSLLGCGGSRDDTSGLTTAAGPGPGTAAATSGTSASTGRDSDDLGSVDTQGDNQSYDPNCGKEEFELEPLPPNLMFVLDQSGSMTYPDTGVWDHDNNPATPAVTRWFSLHGIVVGVATKLDTTANLGLKLYPRNGATGCEVDPGVDVPVAPLNAIKILPALSPASAVFEGFTPARVAMTHVVEHMRMLTDPNPEVVVLVTDGAPNCTGTAADNVFDPMLNDVVKAAHDNDGIITYVVGIAMKPGGTPDTYAFMNQVAMSGGAPKNDPVEQFYSAAAATDLESALLQIGETIQSCNVELDKPPEHPGLVDVEVGGKPYQRLTKCEKKDGTVKTGWVFTGPEDDPTGIRVCGEACEQLKQTGDLNAIYRCPPPR